MGIMQIKRWKMSRNKKSENLKKFIFIFEKE